MCRNILFLFTLGACTVSVASATTLGCGILNAPISSSLTVACGQIVFFGLDTRGNAINPLPSGGSLILASAFSYAINGGYDHELDLDFRFVPGAPAPTELIFAIEGSDWRQLGLGTNLPGFECGTAPCTDIPAAGLTGSFTITEHVQGITSPDVTISQDPLSHNATSSLAFGHESPILVTTRVSGDSNLLGFQESFVVPEAGNIVLFTSGLLGIAALRRRRKTRCASRGRGSRTYLLSESASTA
jgi:hypothetical protein